MATPTYVRLAKRLERGIVADLDSGWSIAGLDVRKTPDKSENGSAFKFVKKALADGRLEGASKAEWEEVHDTEDIEREALEGRPRPGIVNSQEAHIQREAERKRKKLSEGRDKKKGKKGKKSRAEVEEDDDLEETGTDDDDETDENEGENTGE